MATGTDGRRFESVDRIHFPPGFAREAAALARAEHLAAAGVPGQHIRMEIGPSGTLDVVADVTLAEAVAAGFSTFELGVLLGRARIVGPDLEAALAELARLGIEANWVRLEADGYRETHDVRGRSL